MKLIAAVLVAVFLAASPAAAFCPILHPKKTAHAAMRPIKVVGKDVAKGAKAAGEVVLLGVGAVAGVMLCLGGGGICK